jgi:P27 family predicted phage terminase small subunit
MRDKKRPSALELVQRGAESATKRSKPKTKPQQEKASFAPPKRLSASQAAIWTEVEPTVNLKPCDLFMLETLVCLLDQQRYLQVAVNKDGPIIKQKNGRAMHNPAASALRQLEPQLTRCFKELGMSPATRKRLKLDSSVTVDTSFWAEF